MVVRFINDASISHKLTALVFIAVVLALALSCVAFAANHYWFANDVMVQQLDSLAEVLGANASAALVFDDAEAAGEILSSLRRHPIIRSAQLRTPAGELFAQYLRAGTRPPGDQLVLPGVTVRDDRLIVCRVISDDAHEPLGCISLAAGLDVVNEKLYSYLRIAGAVACVSLAAALLFAWPLQRSLAGPILALAEAAGRVSREDDYSIRVSERGRDEIGDLCRQFNKMLSRVEAGERELQEAHASLEKRVEERTAQLSRVNQDLNAEVAERERAEQELAETHRELVEAARHAGMAEIATGVLHNVGNVLNSVNISASTIDERLRNPKRRQLDRVIDLLEANRADLGRYLTEDERGKNVPALLGKLAETLGEDDRELVEEARLLAENISHIKAVISTQQSFAGSGGLLEVVDVNAVLEDALRLNATSFTKHSVQVKRELEELSPVVIDKQRLMQIVVNLVKNAKEALAHQDAAERVLTLRACADEGRLRIQVSDTGVGIAPEALAKIFSHGYTTKRDGHGFGLHSCANAAREMGGTLTVASDGEMRGATFTLELPMDAKDGRASADRHTLASEDER